MRDWIERFPKYGECLPVYGVCVRRTYDIRACGVNCGVNHERSQVKYPERTILLPRFLKYLAFVIHEKQVRRLNQLEVETLQKKAIRTRCSNAKFKQDTQMG